MQAINLTNNVIIVAVLDVADTPFSRMKGLLGRKSLDEDNGLLITQCNSIHMMFMKFPLDVIFLDKSDQVVGLVSNIPPFALSPIYFKAEKAIEVVAGSIERKGIKIGDRICFRAQ